MSAKAELVREEYWKRVRDDEKPFIEKTFSIRTKKAKQEQLILNSPQMYLETLEHDTIVSGGFVRDAVLKYRQLGSSTYYVAKTAAKTCSRRNWRSLIIAHQKDRAKTLFRLLRRFVNQVDPVLRPNFDTDSTTEIYCEDTDSSAAIATAKTPEAVRGDMVNWVIASEADYFLGEGGSLFTVLDALLPMVPQEPGTGVITETTANTTAGEYFTFFNQAMEGLNGFRPIFLLWSKDPTLEKSFHHHEGEEKLPWHVRKEARNMCRECKNRRLEFFTTFCDTELKDRAKKYKLTPEQVHWYWHTLNTVMRGNRLKMAQEYPCDWKEAFIAAGTPVFDKTLLTRLKAAAYKGKLYEAPEHEITHKDDLLPNEDLVRGKDVYLEIWHHPVAEKRYVISGDSSAGNERSNPSAAFIMDLDTMGICGVLHGRIVPDDFAYYLARLGGYYNYALVAPEMQQTGYAVLAPLQKIYTNIYQVNRLKPGGWEETSTLGWSTDRATRPFMVALGRKLLSAYRGDFAGLAARMPCQELIEEMMLFTYGHLNRGKAAAKVGANDDLVMAFLICLGVAHQELGLGLNEELVGTLKKVEKEEVAGLKPEQKFTDYMKELEKFMSGDHERWN